ncbi:MAG: hypothetical protein A3A08_02245 [Candidatus Nealsonbacteria bacterium RIFCSPLOWO2_01_FULL_41_9]|uniref:VOC domain-containing protein n=1 Tax=Candidatus Nealsonbacteria bacterium RIFCSPLOWO2_01_FULL_41_9 TaxID=1801671 RepID=A0A1G2EBM4_9BACT|nr:MAG: hypothetical protein A3A08_02245 [Candidatus Nealsonbacteria bacterium RIFCSPLOWO2_01_FULL_41_9]
MIKGFRHICILIEDLGGALKFYREILGLKLSKVVTVKGTYPETVLGIKGANLTYVKLYGQNQSKNSQPILELHYWHNPKKSLQQKQGHISFTVKDLDSEYKRLCKAGVKFISKPIKAPGGRSKICFCYDPDNNLIELIEDL